MAPESKRERAQFEQSKQAYQRGFEDGQRAAAGRESDDTAPAVGARKAIETLTGMMARDDGWLRVVPEETGRVVWVKWKFTSGRHEGRYVLYKGSNFPSWTNLAAGISGKLVNADLGLLVPSPDKFYEG